jgi:hypothetical protein
VVKDEHEAWTKDQGGWKTNHGWLTHGDIDKQLYMCEE